MTILGRASAEPRLLQIDNFVASRRRIWRCDRSNRPLRTHGVYWLAQRKHLQLLDRANRAGSSIVALKQSAVIGPTPGAVINRRICASWRASFHNLAVKLTNLAARQHCALPAAV